MPTIAVQLTPGNLDPNPCFPDEQSRFNAYVAKIQSNLPINFTTVIVSSTAPNPDDRDKVWIKVDGAGRILGTFLFSNGQWQTIFPVAPIITPGEWREYDPAFYTPAQSANEPWFPGDGTVAGVRNRKGMFLVGAGQRTLPAGSTDTATNFIAGTSGGRETLVLLKSNLPAHGDTHGLLGFRAGWSATAGGPGPFIADQRQTSVQGYIDGGNTTGLDVNSQPNPPVPASTLLPYEPTYWMQWRPDLV